MYIYIYDKILKEFDLQIYDFMKFVQKDFC